MKLPELKKGETYAKVEIMRINSVGSDNNSFSEKAIKFCVKNWRKTLDPIMRDKNKKIIGRIVNVIYAPADKALQAIAIIKENRVKEQMPVNIEFVDKLQ